MFRFFTLFAFSLFILGHSATAANASTVYIDGKTISSINTTAKADILSGYYNKEHTLAIDKAANYGYINSSNGSSDTGFAEDFYKVNIVDFLLENRAGSFDYVNDTYTDNNSYTFLGSFSGTWQTSGFKASIIEEIAGYQNSNTLNYYVANNNGADVDPAKASVVFTGPDSKWATSEVILQSPQKIGFFLGVPMTGGRYFTEAYQNINDEIHSAVFRIGNSNSYIIGFEDLRLGVADRDYQDMIVAVTMAPIPNPEPGTLLLMGIGAAGAAFMNRRNKKMAG